MYTPFIYLMLLKGTRALQKLHGCQGQHSRTPPLGETMSGKKFSVCITDGPFQVKKRLPFAPSFVEFLRLFQRFRTVATQTPRHESKDVAEVPLLKQQHLGVEHHSAEPVRVFHFTWQKVRLVMSNTLGEDWGTYAGRKAAAALYISK